jgi:hypothetical protein
MLYDGRAEDGLPTAGNTVKPEERMGLFLPISKSLALYEPCSGALVALLKSIDVVLGRIWS